MEVKPLAIPGVFEIWPARHGDDRGFFSEVYSERRLQEAGLPSRFVQDNHSWSSRKGVIRGLHYQLQPRAQAKLVRVSRGAVLDVAVDVRRSSPTFGAWVAVELSASAWNQLLIPQGFAHGFMTLTDEAEVLYKTSEPYSPEHDRAIRFDDPDVGIAWPLADIEPIVSLRDRAAPRLAEAEIFD